MKRPALWVDVPLFAGNENRFGDSLLIQTTFLRRIVAAKLSRWSRECTYARTAVWKTCEFAGNSDPLRGGFRVQSFSAGAGWEGLGDDCGGHDRRDTACLFRAAPADQGDRTGAVGVARNGAQGGPRSGDGVQVRARHAADAEARRVDRSPDGDPGGGSEAASA